MLIVLSCQCSQSVFLVVVLRLLGCLEYMLQLPRLLLLGKGRLFAQHAFLGLLSLDLAGVAIGATSLRLRLDFPLFFEEVGVHLENMLVKVAGLKA